MVKIHSASFVEHAEVLNPEFGPVYAPAVLLHLRNSSKQPLHRAKIFGGEGLERRVCLVPTKVGSGFWHYAKKSSPCFSNFAKRFWLLRV